MCKDGVQECEKLSVKVCERTVVGGAKALIGYILCSCKLILSTLVYFAELTN